jgi:hypothetical protein
MTTPAQLQPQLLLLPTEANDAMKAADGFGRYDKAEPIMLTNSPGPDKPRQGVRRRLASGDWSIRSKSRRRVAGTKPALSGAA